MMIISSDWKSLIDTLRSKGLSFSGMRRSPIRIDGRWVAII